MRFPSRVGLVLALLATAAGALAHTGKTHGPTSTFDPAKVEDTPFGRQGNPAKVDRTIHVRMSDRMRFEPSSMAVRKGETIRFIVANKGAVLHEMVLGTPESLKAHAALMKKHPGMEHDEPSMAHVKPGARGEIIWQFTQAGTFAFGCLIPGHFEAGMAGTVSVK